MIICLWFHLAKKTTAKTWWSVRYQGKAYGLQEAQKLGLLRFVRSTRSEEKTHWDEYYEVLNPDVFLVCNRITNAGTQTKSCSTVNFFKYFLGR